ncbi:MAG: amidohydrolase [Candidatus Omnitrophica bacterium]|nr:amidohydrolase [Candidatus Omnitrophota bacterium]
MRIFDGHAHYIPPDIAKNTAFFKSHWSDIARLLAVMDANEIERALLLYPTTDAHLNMGGWAKVCRMYNQEIAALVDQHPDRLSGAGIVPADDPAELAAELARINKYGFPAVSLASSYDGRYLDDDYFAPLYEFCAAKNIVIHVHPQIINPIGEERVKDPLLTPVLEYVFDVSICIGKMLMSQIFLKYPDVKFIFSYYGGVLPWVKERFDNTYEMLRGRGLVKDLGKSPGSYFQNIYLDMSGANSPAALCCALEMTDSRHIIFGSDFPANQNISKTVQAVEGARLMPLDKQNILRDNLKCIFR